MNLLYCFVVEFAYLGGVGRIWRKLDRGRWTWILYSNIYIDAALDHYANELLHLQDKLAPVNSCYKSFLKWFTRERASYPCLRRWGKITLEEHLVFGIHKTVRRKIRSFLDITVTFQNEVRGSHFCIARYLINNTSNQKTCSEIRRNCQAFAV